MNYCREFARVDDSQWFARRAHNTVSPDSERSSGARSGAMPIATTAQPAAAGQSPDNGAGS